MLLLRVLLVLDAFDQVLQLASDSRTRRALLDAALVGGLLVGVDRRRGSRAARGAGPAPCARCTTSSLSGSATEARIGDDRHRDHELDQREARRASRSLRRAACTPPKGTMVEPGGGAAAPAARGGGAAGSAAAAPRLRRRLRRQRRMIGAARRPGAARRWRPRCRRRTRPSRPRAARACARRRGVMSSTISVLLRLSVVCENSRPTTGSSPRPGTRSAVRRSSSLIRPASTWVSPSRSRSVVAALRVPIW